jgi:hypothetical protein
MRAMKARASKVEELLPDAEVSAFDLLLQDGHHNTIKELTGHLPLAQNFVEHGKYIFYI